MSINTFHDLKLPLKIITFNANVFTGLFSIRLLFVSGKKKDLLLTIRGKKRRFKALLHFPIHLLYTVYVLE